MTRPQTNGGDYIEVAERIEQVAEARVISREKLIARIIGNDPRQAISRPLGLYMQQKDRERTIREGFIAMDSAHPLKVAPVEPVEAQREDTVEADTLKVVALVQGEPTRSSFDGARA